MSSCAFASASLEDPVYRKGSTGQWEMLYMTRRCMYEGDKQQIASLHPSLIWSRHWSKFGWKLLTFCKPVFTWNIDFFFFKLMTNYLYLRKLFLRWGGVLGVIVCVLQNTLAIQENKYFTQMWHPCAMFPGSYSSVIFLLFFLFQASPWDSFFCVCL